MGAPLVAALGEPALTSAFIPQRFYDRADFERRAKSGRPPVKRWPDGVGDGARYAFVPYQDRELTAIVDGDADRGYRMVLDCNGDGDLADDAWGEARLEEGLYTVAFEPPTPCAPLKLAVPGRGIQMMQGLEGSLFVYLSTVRRGAIALPESPVAFAVGGSAGRYGQPESVVYFDVDGDGSVEFGALSDERYQVRDRSVWLHGAPYAFAVAPDGSSLTLTPMANAAPARVRLDPGHPAPDFAFEDLDGQRHHLSDYRGKTVLLYAWTTWCGPCAEALPLLRETREKFAARGFEVLTLNRGEPPKTVAAYAARATLPGVVGLDLGESIAELYRFRGVPGYTLIDRYGYVADREVHATDLAERLREMLSDSATASPPQ